MIGTRMDRSQSVARATSLQDAKLVDSGTTFLPIAAILAAVILWGASFATMRVAVQSLTATAVMWSRMVGAFVLLLPFAGKLWPRSVKPGDWKYIGLMVLFQPCLYFLCESNALRFTTSSQAGVIAASVPLLVTAGAWLFLAESISVRTVVGLAAAVSGVVALTLLESPAGSTASNPLLGNFLELLAMISGAASLLMIKQLSRRYSPWTLTAIQVAAGVVFFLPGAFDLWHAPREVWNPNLVVILLFLGVFVTLCAFGLYNWGMSRIPASRASAFINLVPVFAVLIGWTALGEGLSPNQCLAAAVVAGGVWWSQR